MEEEEEKASSRSYSTTVPPLVPHAASAGRAGDHAAQKSAPARGSSRATGDLRARRANSLSAPSAPQLKNKPGSLGCAHTPCAAPRCGSYSAVAGDRIAGTEPAAHSRANAAAPASAPCRIRHSSTAPPSHPSRNEEVLEGSLEPSRARTCAL